MEANCEESDQTLRSVASGLVLHCLLMSHKKDTMPKWVQKRLFLQSYAMEVTVRDG